MMYIVINSNSVDQKEITWNVGSKLKMDSTDLISVDEVQVDGHELNFVKNKLPNIKIGKNRVETISGQDAMEVAALVLAQN